MISENFTDDFIDGCSLNESLLGQNIVRFPFMFAYIVVFLVCLFGKQSWFSNKSYLFFICYFYFCSISLFHHQNLAMKIIDNKKCHCFHNFRQSLHNICDLHTSIDANGNKLFSHEFGSGRPTCRHILHSPDNASHFWITGSKLAVWYVALCKW